VIPLCAAALRASKLVLAHTAGRRMPDPTIVELGALPAGMRRRLSI
jgi:hypothetical protein